MVWDGAHEDCELGAMVSELQQARVDAVLRHLRARKVRSAIDLGCGGGDLLLKLAEEPRLQRIVGLDLSCSALRIAQSRLGLASLNQNPRIRLVHGSFTEENEVFSGFDAAVLLETIEHIDASELPALEDTLFGSFRPQYVIVTTPNRDYNPVYGLGPDELRHPDHRFEWGRLKFRRWAQGVAGRRNYDAVMLDIGEPHWELGPPTQMVLFSVHG